MEEFALASDRRKSLERLVPGTEDYYYYNCLQCQHEGDLERVDALLGSWLDSFGSTARHELVRRRQTLLRYADDPERCCESIRYELGLHFDHQQDAERESAGLSSRLDPAFVSRETFERHALELHSDLSDFSDRGLERLLDSDALDADRRRLLLQRLMHPDHPRLVDRIAADLAHRHSGGFGSLAIHALLTEAQLDELVRRKPDLSDNEAWVRCRLLKLRPGPDVDLAHDAQERESFLERLWAFSEKLSPAFNSLKACVLYHRLAHDRSRGVYDRKRFEIYLQLPRHAGYVEPRFLREHESRHRARLDADFSPQIGLEPVRDDEPLVREYLAHFLREAASPAPFERWIQEGWLRRVFAETKILAGAGDLKAWYAMLDDPAAFQALADRVDLDFAPTNPVVFSPADPVRLAVDVKNVENLVIKVFEMNSLNYFLAHGKEVDSGVDLDGLKATWESVERYEQPATLRVRREIDLPELAGRAGVFVAELIGNGKSSRALIRKGALRHTERLGAAGHVFTVLDSDGQALEDASMWLDGHEIRADKGRIRLPFSTEPRSRTALLCHGELSRVIRFLHQAEHYSLHAGIHVDRESLLAGNQAQVLLRPGLRLNGIPVSLKLCSEVRLRIQSTDHQGTSSSSEIADLELSEDRETIHGFRVPENLARIDFQLQVKVRCVSRAEDVDLSDGCSHELNGIDQTDRIAALHLARTDFGHVLSLLGKNGEPRPRMPVTCSFHHRDFQHVERVVLQTDENGQVELGALEGLYCMDAEGAACSETWALAEDGCNTPAVLSGTAGQSLRLAVAAYDGALGRERFALLERRHGSYQSDRYDRLHLRDGYLELQGLEAGDYELVLKEQDRHIEVRVIEGQERAGWLIGSTRAIEIDRHPPLQVTELRVEGARIAIRIAGSTERTRVHVLGSRFAPAFDALGSLGGLPFPAARDKRHSVLETHYLSGRDIGDEYRYILDRKYADKHPGNLLERPGLLLNPWAVRQTSTGLDDIAGGDAYRSLGQAADEPCAQAPSPPSGGSAGNRAFARLDFLPGAAFLAANLQPDDGGWVHIPLADLSACSQVRVLAIDGPAAVMRCLSLREPTLAMRDLRLVDGLPPDEHFIEKKQVAGLAAGDSLVIEDITTSKVEILDDLARIMRLFQTVSNDAKLPTFQFVTRWDRLSDEERSKLYSEHACHELSFFLSRKDPDFFSGTVEPYLQNKKRKTFMDRYLLGQDLQAYLRPWAYGRLNMVERILLAERLAPEKGPTERHAGDLLELQPPDPEGDERLFHTALEGSALETQDGLGFGLAKQKATERKRAGKKARKPARSAMRSEAGKITAAAMTISESFEEDKCAECEALMDMDMDMEDGADLLARADFKPLYRKLDKTQEWAENHYHHLTLEQQGPELVTINAFWRDFARHDGSRPFLSAHLLRATRSFTEMMLALAVLDVPFAASEHEIHYAGSRMTLRAGSPALVFYSQIASVQPAAERMPILVSQNYFRADDRTVWEDGEQRDKYIGDEILVQTVYVCQVVLTNPSSSRQKVDLLLQIPQGSIPVATGFVTRGAAVQIEPYGTHLTEYCFYFPTDGHFDHFPAHLAHNEQLVKAAEPRQLKVVRSPSRIDESSWPWLSQHGGSEAILRHLEAHNIERLDLDPIAWRMRDRGFYSKVLGLLTRRHVYSDTLWSYSIFHNDQAHMQEYLKHQSGFLDRCGLYLESPLMTVDATERDVYEHLEYAPLVNARAHRLGSEFKILNDRFAEQYRRFIDLLCQKPEPDDEDWLAACCYLLLQERVGDAQKAFGRVDPRKISTHLQHAYFECYLAFYGDEPGRVRSLAEKHRDHPVPRWRIRFQNVLAQIDEAEGGTARAVDKDDRDQRQAALADLEPSFDFDVEGREVSLHYRNLRACRVSYFEMDIELLFSRQPFVQQQSGQFAFIRPNRSEEIALPEGQTEFRFELPEAYRRSNLMVEIEAGGVRKARACYAHELDVQVSEPYGMLRVGRRADGRPLVRTYVKTYARMQGGSVRFYKDGYTDLRGRFDYSSLSTDELDRTERFALLVLHEEHGAVILEAEPPTR
ncbi:MAG: hypothetical protein JXR96_05395 [Deltaproteobacteria bacterium]|nr:hypothetical protein [Deltaproteobacteria bacterium]